MSKNNSKFNRFKYYSEQAAKNEREGNLQDAKEQWAVAGMNANKPTNKEWCKYRAAFCDRVLRKPF